MLSFKGYLCLIGAQLFAVNKVHMDIVIEIQIRSYVFREIVAASPKGHRDGAAIVLARFKFDLFPPARTAPAWIEDRPLPPALPATNRAFVCNVDEEAVEECSLLSGL